MDTQPGRRLNAEGGEALHAAESVGIRLGDWGATLVPLDRNGAHSVAHLAERLSSCGFVSRPQEDAREFVAVSGPLLPATAMGPGETPAAASDPWEAFLVALVDAHGAFTSRPDSRKSHRGSGAFTFSWPPEDGPQPASHPRMTALATPEDPQRTSLRLLALLLFLASRWHVANGGLIVHSSAVARDGEGFVFLGDSDAGKTSVARWSREAGLPALGDDVNFLIPRGDGYSVAAAPGPKLSPAGYSEGRPSLRAILSLRKAPEDSVSRITPVRTAALLCAAFLQSPPGSALHPDAIALAFGTACRIARTVPGYEMGFRKGPGFWKVIDREIPPRGIACGPTARDEAIRAGMMDVMDASDSLSLA